MSCNECGRRTDHKMGCSNREGRGIAISMPLMSDTGYTPTTDEVRAAASRAIGSDWFDRWLAAHDAATRKRTLHGALTDEQIADLWDWDISQHWVRVKLASRLRDAGYVVVRAEQEGGDRG